MGYLLTVDVGNTHSLFALCNAHGIAHHWRLATNAHRTEDEYAGLLLPLFAQANLESADISAAIIASVVPDALFPLRCYCERYLKTQALIVGKEPLHTGMAVEIDHPEELGADRLVNAIAAWERWQRPLIVVDFGTATTFDMVNEKGTYIGGVIAPGVNLSLEALTAAAAKLHGIPIRQPESVIGKNTTHAMQSGIYFGYLGLVNTVIDQVQQEHPEMDFVVATGGLAPLYARNNPSIHHIEPELTIYGLQLLYQRNKG